MHKPLVPQDHCPPDSLKLSLVERPLAGMVNLRGSLHDPTFTDRVSKTIGLPLPSPNCFVTRDDIQCIWQGPDEWLLVVPDGRQHAVAEQLEDALAGLHHAVTDVTGNRVLFRLSGTNAIKLLASGCSLDFAPPSFPRGTAAQTILARTPVTILRVDDTLSFEIHTRRSYSGWVRDWLLQAAESVNSS